MACHPGWAATNLQAVGPPRSHWRSYAVETAQQLWTISERLTGVTYTALAAAATPVLAEERVLDTEAASGDPAAVDGGLA